MEEVKVERSFEFGYGKQHTLYKGRQKHKPQEKKCQKLAGSFKENVVAAGKEGKVTKYRTQFYSDMGNVEQKRAQK